jgi:hypothetical protein
VSSFFSESASLMVAAWVMAVKFLCSKEEIVADISSLF